VNKAENFPPLYIRVNPRDNVAIIVNEGGLAAGTRFGCGLVLVDMVPEAHKVALTEIGVGQPIVRYGVAIGYAEMPIGEGSWVHEGMLRLPEPPRLDRLPISTAVPEPLLPLDGYTFEGYLNHDGSAGTRNILGVTTTVQCVAPTVDYAVKRIKQELLPRYPRVDDVIAVNHAYGCGVAIDAPGAEIPDKISYSGLFAFRHSQWVHPSERHAGIHAITPALQPASAQ
jgi:galactarate dehydratase